MHRIVRHLWEVPGARVGIFGISIKMVKDAGMWMDLTGPILQEWFDSGIGMHYTTINSSGNPGPISDSQTRTMIFRVRNYWGGESECMLFSLNNEDEIQSKVKNKSFSMLYFPELTNFKTDRVLSITLPQLRMQHLRPGIGSKDRDPHQWIADTNPDEVLGYRSWVYKVFFEGRHKKWNLEDEDEAVMAEYYQDMEVIEMNYIENPYITRREIVTLKASTMADQALHDAYVEGKWGDAGIRASHHFSQFFLPAVHVVGTDDEQIHVEPSTAELFTGSDIGQVNHSWVILQKRIVLMGGVFVSIWDVLDELCYLKEREDLKNMGLEMAKQMDELEKKWGRTFEWKHWTDSSALDQWRPGSASFDYQEIYAGSGGRVNMLGVSKPDGSVRARVRMLRQLLMQNRIFISARCEKVLEMIRECRKGEADKDYVMADQKHMMDALTYPIFMESFDEFLSLSSRPQASKHSGMVSVG